MKKAIVVWLIVAGVLVLLGVALFVCVLAMNRWEFERALGLTEFETATFEVDEAFSSIDIHVLEEDVSLVESEDGTCRAVIFDEENIRHSVSVENGTLTVGTVGLRPWYESIFSFRFHSPKITLYLPETEYAALTVESHTGDIEVTDAFLFESIEITASTGDVACFAPATDHMKIKTSTGDIRVESVLAGALDLAVTTGRVDVSSVVCTGDLTLSVSTGRSTLKDVLCKSFATSGSTGDLTMENVIALDTISIERSTGDVRFTTCDAQEITIETDTGDVTGSLRSAMVFTTKTDTGSVDVPASTSGGRVSITTDTGDIRITMP